MKLKDGDTVRVIKKIHPWKRNSRRDYYGLVATVVGKRYVPKSKYVPSGVIVRIRFGSQKVGEVPSHYLKKIKEQLDNPEETC